MNPAAGLPVNLAATQIMERGWQDATRYMSKNPKTE